MFLVAVPVYVCVCVCMRDAARETYTTVYNILYTRFCVCFSREKLLTHILIYTFLRRWRATTRKTTRPAAAACPRYKGARRRPLVTTTGRNVEKTDSAIALPPEYTYRRAYLFLTPLYTTRGVYYNIIYIYRPSSSVLRLFCAARGEKRIGKKERKKKNLLCPKEKFPDA